MSAALYLSTLSIESAEIDLAERVDTEAGFKDQLENPIFTKEYEDAQLVFSTLKRIRERGFVCRADIADVQHLAETSSPIKRLLARYPLASFTEEPSAVNLQVSNESLVRTVWTALKEAFFRILKFLRESFTRVWDNLTSGRKRTMEIDKIGPRLDAMQRYILDVDSLMVDSPLGEEYQKWQRRNIASAANNLSKNWNGLKNEVATNPTVVKEAAALFVDTLVLRTAPMAIMLEELMSDLTKATSAGDIAAAVTKAQMFDITTPALVKMAAAQGWKLTATRVDPRITPFKSLVSYITGVYRSLSNNRMDIKPETLTKLIAELKVDQWQDLVPADLPMHRKRLDSALARLQGFDVESLDASLEPQYTGIVIPFINMVSVQVSALSDLQGLASMIISTRDSTILDLANTGLSICRGMEAYVSKERSKIPPAIVIEIVRRTQQLKNTF